MSDDLVKRLRDLGDHAAFEPHMHHTAADRIEELEADLRTTKISAVFWQDGWRALDQDKRVIEAKLAKAVEALDKIKRIDNLVGVFAACERTLAELTGGKDE